ncbi:helix-turn-helix domain-containing protein [Pseudomonadota bacterium]
MNWAWRQNLRPTSKLILMAIADSADDQGICWPAVPTVAAKCSVSDRTVQRVIQMLTADGLMIAEERYRPNGSRASNRYQLQIEGGDKLSPPHDRDGTTPRHNCHHPPDTGVTPRTTTEPKKESPPLPLRVESAHTTPSSKECGSGFFVSDLVFPKNILPAERSQSEQNICTLTNLGVAQQVLDEWAGIISAGKIHTSKLGCLRGLIKKAQEGSFTLEQGQKISAARKKQQQLAVREEKVKAQSHPPVLVDDNNLLVQRITALSKQEKKEEPQIPDNH